MGMTGKEDKGRFALCRIWQISTANLHVIHVAKPSSAATRESTITCGSCTIPWRASRMSPARSSACRTFVPRTIGWIPSRALRMSAISSSWNTIMERRRPTSWFSSPSRNLPMGRETRLGSPAVPLFLTRPSLRPTSLDLALPT